MYASFGKRALALLLDTFILSFIIGISSKIFGIGNPEAISQMMETGNYAALSGLFASNTIIQTLYFAGMESSEKQATLGKMALGIKVVNTDGGRLSFMSAVLRSIGKYISGFIFFIGYIMAGFTRKSQALHDMIAGTVVVPNDSRYLDA